MFAQVRIALLPGVFVLVLGLGLIIGLVLLLTRQHTRKYGLILLSILILPLLLILTLRISHSVPPARRVSSNTHTVVPIPEPITTPPAIWSEGIENRFQADIYPSAKGAGYALGRALARTLQTEGVEAPVVIDFNDSKLKWGVSACIISSMKNLNQDFTIRTHHMISHPCSACPEEQHVRINLSSSRDDQQKQLIARVASSPNISSMVSVSFLDVEWLSDTALFLNLPTNRHHSVVYSTESCNSAGEAKRQAQQQGQHYIKNLLQKQGHNLAVTSADLSQYNLIADSFTQSFKGTAGPIWRQALLLDTSPQKLQRLTEAKLVQRHQRHKTWAHYLGSALGLAVLLFILYIFLNAATRGYYTWALRLFALLSIGAIIVVLFKVFGIGGSVQLF